MLVVGNGERRKLVPQDQYMITWIVEIEIIISSTYGNLKSHIRSKYSNVCWRTMSSWPKIIWSKRNWTDSPTCMFCSQNETPVHLFFQCPVAKCVQGIVGACMGANYIPGRLGICTNTKYGYNICYQMGKLFTILAMQLYPGLSGSARLDRKQIRHPAEIIICACTFMSYWVGLFSATVLRFRVRWWTGSRWCWRLHTSCWLNRTGLQRPRIVQMKKSMNEVKHKSSGKGWPRKQGRKKSFSIFWDIIIF